MPQFNFPFTNRAMTLEVRKHPKRYGLVSALNIFPLEPINSTLVQITNDNGVLRVVAASERGAPGQKVERKRQDLKIFQVPHFPIEDQILAKDLQDRKIVVDGVEVAANLPDEVARRLTEIARRNAITAEYLRVQALKGIIRDGDGTVLTNLFEDFDQTEKVVNFNLSSDTTNVREKDEEARAHIEDNLLGETIDGVEVLCSPEFFGKLVDHPKVRDLYNNSPDVREVRQLERYQRGGITGRIFNPFGGVTYIEYRGSAPVKSGSERFIDADKARAYPLGTNNLFATFGAPADTLDEVNDLPTVSSLDLGDGLEPFALPTFVSSEIMKHGKGVEMWAEMNILPINKQPGASLVECVA